MALQLMFVILKINITLPFVDIRQSSRNKAVGIEKNITCYWEICHQTNILFDNMLYDELLFNKKMLFNAMLCNNTIMFSDSMLSSYDTFMFSDTIELCCRKVLHYVIS
jgi:hypothetical protein